MFSISVLFRRRILDFYDKPYRRDCIDCIIFKEGYWASSVKDVTGLKQCGVGGISFMVIETPEVSYVLSWKEEGLKVFVY